MTRAAFILILSAGILLAQRGGGPAGGGPAAGGPVGAPMGARAVGGGQARPSVSGPRLTATVPMGGTAASSMPNGIYGGFGASMLPPPVPPALPRAGGRRGYGGYGVGGYAYPVSVYGTGFDNFYRSVHNPPPGTYDPIFGVYGGDIASAPAEVVQGQPASPSVVINQYFQTDNVRPQIRDYSNVNLPEPGVTMSPPPPAAGNGASQGDAQFYFLIATKDSTIHAVAAYWVTGNTLNFVTLQGVRSSMPLDQVDRDLSKRLNTGRSIDFELPAQ